VKNPLKDAITEISLVFRDLERSGHAKHWKIPLVKGKRAWPAEFYNLQYGGREDF
jgi:hypothetical protein